MAKKINDEELENVNGGFWIFGKKTQTSNVKLQAATRVGPSSSCDKFEKRSDAGLIALSICKNCKYYHSEGVDAGVCNNENKGQTTQNI